ncbi:MAG: hypothetical protein EBY58_10750, partial [Rhodobacteraceae bacterium]|nr:hypothetical protein [Paracoccaceae bacterium]
MFYPVFMADMMPKQVITFHHFDESSEDRAENFFAILYSANHMADHFRVDRAIGNGCHSEIRNVNCIRTRIDFLFWYHCYGCFICIRVRKIRDWVFEHQLQMVDGHSLCVWM